MRVLPCHLCGTMFLNQTEEETQNCRHSNDGGARCQGSVTKGLPVPRQPQVSQATLGLPQLVQAFSGEHGITERNMGSPSHDCQLPEEATQTALPSFFDVFWTSTMHVTYDVRGDVCGPIPHEVQNQSGVQTDKTALLPAVRIPLRHASRQVCPPSLCALPSCVPHLLRETLEKEATLKCVQTRLEKSRAE